MQKLINAIALLSGLVSLGVIGGGTYLYINKDVMIENARTKVTEEITKTITEALPGMVNSAIPEMPSMTGGVVSESTQSPLPNVTGGAIPF